MDVVEEEEEEEKRSSEVWISLSSVERRGIMFDRKGWVGVGIGVKVGEDSRMCGVRRGSRYGGSDFEDSDHREDDDDV